MREGEKKKARNTEREERERVKERERKGSYMEKEGIRSNEKEKC